MRPSRIPACVAVGSATVAADRLASDLRNSRLSIICTPPGILRLFDFDRTAGTPSSLDETVRDVRKPPITADARRLGWDTDEHGAARLEFRLQPARDFARPPAHGIGDAIQAYQTKGKSNGREDSHQHIPRDLRGHGPPPMPSLDHGQAAPRLGANLTIL